MSADAEPTDWLTQGRGLDGKWREIHSPLLASDNDTIDFYARAEGGRLRMTDDGWICADLDAHGIRDVLRTFGKVTRGFGKEFGVVGDGEITYEGRDGNRPQALSLFAACLAACDRIGLEENL